MIQFHLRQVIVVIWVIMTSSEKIGDKEYFQQGFEYLNDTKAMYSMYKFLKERNVPKRLDFH